MGSAPGHAKVVCLIRIRGVVAGLYVPSDRNRTLIMLPARTTRAYLNIPPIGGILGNAWWLGNSRSELGRVHNDSRQYKSSVSIDTDRIR